MAANIFAGLLGALVGAVLISGALFVAFRLFGLDIPRWSNLWKAAFVASAAVIVIDGVISALIPGASGSLPVLAVALVGAFFAYDRMLVTPDGSRMGRKAAFVALGTHAAFSTAMFLLLAPIILGALL
jgi:hypothetical protein